jgi:hypothetical protein
MRQFLIKCSRKAFGWPPAPASFVEKRDLIIRKARENGIKNFVETGTFRGTMIEAQRVHFKRLISIELGVELFRAACSRFASNPEIQLHQGDSAVKLREVVVDLHEPALFWLDAHYSRGITAGVGEKAPILKELSCLTSRNQMRDVILIDDARLFGLNPAYPRLKIVRQFVAQHLPDRLFAVENDVICIEPAPIPDAASR